MLSVEPRPPKPAVPSLSDHALAVIARTGAALRVGRGGAVFERGERGSAMYLVRAGEILLEFEAGLRSKRLGPGTFFGELVLVRGDHRRSAAAVALTDCDLIELANGAFDSLLAAEPAVMVELLRLSCDTLLTSEGELVAMLRRRTQELEQALDFLRRTREELDSSELLAQTDELTGIYNRRCFRLQAERLSARAQAQESGLAVILVDVDHFKAINDTFGHLAGDAVLRHLAAALRQSVRWSDLPCRIGGDEFAALLTDFPTPEAGAERARRLFERTGRLTVAASEHSIRVSTSHGAAMLRDGESFDELLARADRSLYLAKQSGRHRLAWEGRVIDDGSSEGSDTA